MGGDEALPPELPPVRRPELGPLMRALHDAGVVTVGRVAEHEVAAPLMRALHDTGVVTGDRGTNQSGLDAYWRLQRLAYLAEHNFGHPGLRYRHDPDSNGRTR